MCKVLAPISSMGRAETGKDIDWEQRQKGREQTWSGDPRTAGLREDRV